MEGVVIHKPTGLCVNPATGQIFSPHWRVPTYRTAEGVPVVMVRSGDGGSATVYPASLIVWEACNGPVAAGMTLQRVAREPKLSALRLVATAKVAL